ncbi:hypothetical protein [Microlunatus ginsengisoli]|uniref:Uncharacterized protein n=1 Tax=Microlunatus ginsengisoli TaxID=363863 RepID=A0ABP7AL91_9ACTN
MSEQQREPAGSPAGGQFASQSMSESHLDLDTGKGYDGSFFAAPPMDSALEVYNYFEEHPPPDTTVFKLRRLVNEYQVELADHRWNADLSTALDTWDQQNPAPSERGRNREREQNEHKLQRDAAERSVVEEMRADPRYQSYKMTPYSARVACKVIARLRAGSRLSRDEQDRLSQWITQTRSVEVPGKHASADELMRTWHLDRFADEILDPEFDQRQMIELLEKIAKDVDRQGYRISEVQNDVLNLR